MFGESAHLATGLVVHDYLSGGGRMLEGRCGLTLLVKENCEI